MIQATNTYRIFAEKIAHTATLPTKATDGSANWDLYAAEEKLLWPGERWVVGTGLRIAVPRHHVLEIYPRSGLAANRGITVLNAPGQIDSDYRGEVKVILLNTSREGLPYRVEIGSRIAQCRLVPVVHFQWQECEVMVDTERGEGGFGSTGT